MMASMRLSFSLLALTFLLAGCGATSEPAGPDASNQPALPAAVGTLAARLLAAMADRGRPAGDGRLDALRKPVAVLEFFEIHDGMTVLDVNAADGYYTELLSAAVGPTGTVYAQNDTETLAREGGAVERALAARLANYRLPNVLRLDEDLGRLQLEEDADAALLVLTLHDLYNLRGEQATVGLLGDVSEALRPGGVLGVVDHVAEVSRSLDARAVHRVEKSAAERMLSAAGFIVEAESDALANVADDHTRSADHDSIRERTDRFVIRARKPWAQEE